MKLINTLLLLLLTCFISEAQDENRLIIIHTNDLHSRIEGFAPEADYTPLVKGNDDTKGGFSRIAALIKNDRAANPGNTLVIDAGDFLMGTLFHTVEEETGFQLPLMKKMGYDVVSLGNHEFDFGLARITSILTRSAGNGPIPEILLGNSVFSSKDKNDDAFEALYDREIIKRTTIIDRAGMKIGLFSLMGINAVEVAPYSAPLTFEKQSHYAAKAVKELRGQGCDMIICISHSGLTKDKKGNWVGEDADIAAKVDGIDLIISGHTHSRLGKPLIINGVPVVQAGEYGKDAGRLVLRKTASGFEVESYTLMPVDDNIDGDRNVEDLIGDQKNIIDRMILKPFRLNYNTPLAEVSFPVDCDQQGDLDKSNLGPLVADAIYYYLNHNTSSGADVSMVSAGVIRDKLVPGEQTVADIFRVMPLGSGRDSVPGYAFSRLYVTGKELKNILEILLVAQRSNSDYYCFFSGIRVRYDPEKGLLKKVSSIEILKTGEAPLPVSFSKSEKRLYSITANSYMLEFIGIIKKKSFGIINVIPKNETGERVTDMKTSIVDIDEKREGIQEGKEWLALTEYLLQMKDTNGNGIADLENRYKSPVPVFEVHTKK